jgi:hypothetical protein
MARRTQSGRGSRNNNPEGHNQYSNGWTDTAKERPLATAAVAAAAVGAGVFLWSRRNQISDQISSLSDQISEWRDGSQSGSNYGSDNDAGADGFIASSARSRGARKPQTQIAEEAMTLKETGKATA